MVFVDNQPIGTTPCSVDFTYYGTREIRLVKSGFETLTVNQPIPAPWYQVPPLDFISDNLWPIPIRDNRTVAFDMQPARLQSIDEIIARGSELRGRYQQEGAMPASAVMPSDAAIAAPGTNDLLTIQPPGAGASAAGPNVFAAPTVDALGTPTAAPPLDAPTIFPPPGLPALPTVPGEPTPVPAPFRY
jgi:hypothetical protein